MTMPTTSAAKPMPMMVRTPASKYPVPNTTTNSAMAAMVGINILRNNAAMVVCCPFTRLPRPRLTFEPVMV